MASNYKIINNKFSSESSKSSDSSESFNKIRDKFFMMDKIPVSGNSDYTNILTSTLERTRVSDIFFSRDNIKIIQNGLRKGVYDKSNQRIIVPEQSEDLVVSVMRSVYYQNSKNLDYNITEQINELNNYVINFCVESVYSEALAYLNYKENLDKMHIPIKAPLYSNKTNKTLELKPWF